MNKFHIFSKDFNNYHKNSYNILVHLFTTFLITGVVLSYLEKETIKNIFILYLLMTKLAIRNDNLWFINSTLTYLSIIFAYNLKLKNRNKLIFFVSLIVIQELSHYVFNEKTYQSTYLFKKGKVFKSLYHTLYLQPLVLNTINEKFLKIFTNQDRTIYVNIKEETLRQDMNDIEKWVYSQNPTKEHTTHWWKSDLPKNLQFSFDRLSDSKEFKDAVYEKFDPKVYDIEVADGMNEIYVAAFSHNSNSDTVFYTKHIDGPLGLFPFANVYRTLIAITDNEYIRTRFP